MALDSKENSIAVSHRSAVALSVLKASWVLPITGAPIANACVLISGNRIEKIVQEHELEVSIAGRDYIEYDYGQSIISPGFINLHAHLEYTALRHLAAEVELFAWLPRLMQATASWSDQDRHDSVLQGIKEIITAGTTFVVDYSYGGASAAPLAQSGLRALVGLEIFGVDEQAADKNWQEWTNRLAQILDDHYTRQAVKDGRLAITAAPHAPYTVCPALWRQASVWAQMNGLMLTTHLAESEAEHHWFTSNEGILRDFLINAFGKKEPGFASLYETKTAWKKGSRTPVEHLYKHGLLTDNLLAAHAVHVNDRDIALLESYSVAIAHCPRSNIKLQCGKAPLKKMLKTKLRIGLGTDSIASNDDLDLLSESRFAIDLHQGGEPCSEIGAKQMIEYLTIKGAQCLNLQSKLGSIEPGKYADLAIFSLAQNGSRSEINADPYELLIRGPSKIKAVFVDGREIIMS